MITDKTWTFDTYWRKLHYAEQWRLPDAVPWSLGLYLDILRRDSTFSFIIGMPLRLSFFAFRPSCRSVLVFNSFEFSSLLSLGFIFEDLGYSVRFSFEILVATFHLQRGKSKINLVGVLNEVEWVTLEQGKFLAVG